MILPPFGLDPKTKEAFTAGVFVPVKASSDLVGPQSIYFYNSYMFTLF